jgi:regulatory protein
VATATSGGRRRVGSVITGRRHRESFAEKRERRAAVDDPAVVLEAGARFLEARARSVGEVRRRLSSAGYRAELIDGAIERLTELGMLDDAAFARAWLESRDRARPRGERALAEELRVKGVDRELIATALGDRRDVASDASGELETPSADEAAAERLLARNARALERVADPRARRQRAYGLLARNGFDPGVCASASARFASALDAEVE